VIHTTHQTPVFDSATPLNLTTDMEPPTTDDDDQWVYAWEEELVDEDGQLWVITMLSVMVMPFYEGFHLSPILFPNFLDKIAKM
jgi:hypothetical protein